MIIPSGKRIRLYVDEQPWLSRQALIRDRVTSIYGGKDYVEVPMYLGEDLSVKTSSEFGSPFSSMQEGAANLGLMLQFVGAGAERFGMSGIADRLRDATPQSKFATYQFWKYSNPISFSINIQFFLGILDLYDAKREVYNPAMRLTEIVLPREYKETGIFKLQAPGPTASSFLKEVGVRNVTARKYSIYIGNIIYLKDCVVKSVEATYSKEVDKSGYPISAKVMMEVSSTTVGTANMIQDMVQGDPSAKAQQELNTIKQQAEEGFLDNIANFATTFLGG